MPIDLDLADPVLKLVLRIRVIRLFKKAPHQAGKGDVFEKLVAIPQPLHAPLRQFSHLQIRYGSKLMRHLIVIVPLVILIGEITDADNADGKDNENQEE